MRRNHAIVRSAAVLVALAAWPAAASAADWTCEASALRAQVLTAPAIEPAVANRGAACQEAGGGGAFAPALPLGLSAGTLTAETLLEGPVTAPAQERVARARGTVADVGIKALPELPIALPDPDFSDVDAVRVPGLPGSIDLRPALEALVQPRSLPNLDLLRVRAADAEASARCVGGVPRFSGSSSLASVSVNGLELGLEKAVTETVRLIDSQTIDPSDVDISRIIAPPGVDLPQALVQPVLDALPDITVPATLARVRVVPNERIESGNRLVQRALRAEITIAGQRLAELVVGEAIVGAGDIGCGGVADLALQCTLRRLVLIDVYEHRGRVKLLGAADRRYVGRRVRIRFMADRRTVARPRVRRDGTFRATAPLPEARIRDTNRARYQASIRKQRSMRLKLARRMKVTELRARGRRVTIAGWVVGPLTRPVRTVAVKRRVTCRDWKVVKRFKPRPDGSFRVNLKAPKDGEAAVYRMSTRVKLYDWFAKTYPTFTLPRYVDLGVSVADPT